MRAFVTGGTGFVGAHLVQALLQRGDDVTCLVRSPAKAAALGWRNVRVVRGDLDNHDALRQGCADADVLRHCRQQGDHIRGCWVVDLALGRD